MNSRNTIEIIRKTHLSLWLHHIGNVWYTRLLIKRWPGDGTICIQAATEVNGQRMVAGKGHFEISGIDNHPQMEKIFNELCDAALVERRGT